MRKFAPYLLTTILACTPCLESKIFADAADSISDHEVSNPSNTSQQSLEINKEVEKAKILLKEPEKVKITIPAFTGKITKNRVRMRIQPSLDSPILKELNHGDLLIIDGEIDDFYTARPPQDLKSYVFRTFILDGVVEGTRVNVRLEPDLESPIIAQLNSGDRVKGMISPLNSKWMEIGTPENTRFYIAKEFVENIGGPNKLNEIAKRKEDVEKLYEDSYANSQMEMQKPFEEIRLETITANLNKILNNYSEFPAQGDKARALLSNLQDNYTKKKLTYLENLAQKNTQTLQAKNQELNAQIEAKDQLINQIQFVKQTPMEDNSNYSSSSTPTAKMTSWASAEQIAYAKWAEHQSTPTVEDFYRQQAEESIILTGILESYQKAVKNKPRDFVLINPANHLPIAYLYSTQVNLQDKVGQKVNLKGSMRPNNNFAFPAYYVISIE